MDYAAHEEIPMFASKQNSKIPIANSDVSIRYSTIPVKSLSQDNRTGARTSAEVARVSDCIE